MGHAGKRQPDELIRSNNTVADSFGAAVTLNGDTIAVSAPHEDSCARGVNGDASNNDCADSDAVYVFTRAEGAWTQQAYLKASSTERNDSFGAVLALSSDRLAVGAPEEASCATGLNGDPTNNGCPRAGAVYVFTRTDTGWRQESYVKASNTEANDVFGQSLALTDAAMAVGAGEEGSCALGLNGDQANNGCFAAGAVYLFMRNGSTWQTPGYMKATNTEPGDRFSSGLALQGRTLAVGAIGESSCAPGINGEQTNNDCAQRARCMSTALHSGTTP